MPLDYDDVEFAQWDYTKGMSGIAQIAQALTVFGIRTYLDPFVEDSDSYGLLFSKKALTPEQIEELSNEYNRCSSSEPKKLVTPPLYVKLGQTALRLVDGAYYRDAGQWEIGFKIISNKILAEGRGNMSHVNGIELVRCSKDEWRNDNKGYV